MSFGAPDEEREDAISTAASDSFDWAASPTEDSTSHRSETAYEDKELLRILSVAVEELELEWAPPAEPEHSRLDEWFLQPGRRRRVGFQRQAPFFPEVHAEVSKIWHALYLARAHNSGPALLNTIDALTHRDIHSVPHHRKHSRESLLCRWTSSLGPPYECHAAIFLSKNAETDG